MHASVVQNSPSGNISEDVVFLWVFCVTIIFCFVVHTEFLTRKHRIYDAVLQNAMLYMPLFFKASCEVHRLQTPGPPVLNFDLSFRPRVSLQHQDEPHSRRWEQLWRTWRRRREGCAESHRLPRGSSVGPVSPSRHAVPIYTETQQGCPWADSTFR